MRGISSLSVKGYKSIWEERSVAIRPLTVLVGPNSSGKSSIMQPLLLLKQTLDASFDPGPLRLDGSNVKFTSRAQLIPRGTGKTVLHIGLGLEPDRSLEVEIAVSVDAEPTVSSMTSSEGAQRSTISPAMSHEEILGADAIPKELAGLFPLRSGKGPKPRWKVVRNRCFLELALLDSSQPPKPWFTTAPATDFEGFLRGLIHVPGLRGNPERAYPVTAVGPSFPGTFEAYAASVIDQWQSADDHGKLHALRESLEALELTWKVQARRLDDTRVQLKVGRLTHPERGGASDLVDIADAGFGMSQCLPVIVALHAAEAKQLLYIEQPEIHLHPRATHRMASLLAAAAKRGVRVVVETHSALLLIGIQELVAKGILRPQDVGLNWFSRDRSGLTNIASAELDEAGAFGDWPEDFGRVSMDAERSYLDAAETRLREGS
jgi:hypothetical protein